MIMIKRVVSSFIVTSDLKVAVFLRRSTLPSFPSHWAACSGSIERNETPWQAAKRELYEETNLGEISCSSTGGGAVEPEAMYGLFVDAPTNRPRLDPDRGSEEGTDKCRNSVVFRVYPFVVRLPANVTLELRGTEHDCFQFVTVSELEALQPSVPMLAQAFHHATFGRYLPRGSLPDAVRSWADNHQDGAMVMAKRALEMVKENPSVDPTGWKMLRPSMVAITNAIDLVIEKQDPDQVLEMIESETNRAVDTAVAVIVSLIQEWSKATTNPTNHLNTDEPISNSCEFRIATFSRSSTLTAVLGRVRDSLCASIPVSISCSLSSPGDEGALMAQDLEQNYPNRVRSVLDVALLESIQDYHLVVIGSDCLMPHGIINKIGSQRLAQAARSHNVPIYCCADRFKLWDDIFPPPLESIFECFPRDLVDRVLLPD